MDTGEAYVPPGLAPGKGFRKEEERVFTVHGLL